MIRLLLADDQALVRGALAALLALEPDLEVVAEVGSGDAVVEAVREHQPDVALLDVEMPGLDGISAAAAVREQFPQVRVLIAAGRRDPIVQPVQSQALADLLTQAGADVTLHWTPGGHNLTREDLEVGERWMAAVTLAS